MSNEIKVGDALWLHAPYENSRERRWKQEVVTSVTSQSYIVGEGFQETKIRKSDMTWLRRPGERARAYTEVGRAERIWVDENKNRITSAVSVAPYAVLKQIEEILAKMETEE